MKLRLTILMMLFISAEILAQTSGIHYKAIVKDNSGNILENANVTVLFDIREHPSQIIAYSETHSTTTDENGLVIVTIGQGNTSDIFDDIQWERSEHYLDVKINIGSGIVNLGSSQFMAVPYSLQAEHSNFSDEADTAKRLLLKSSTSNQFTISYDTPNDKLRIAENGVSGNVLELKNGELYLPQYADSNNGPLKVDAAGKVVSESVPQIEIYNRFEFDDREVFSNYTKLIKGVQFPDGTRITGIKAMLMDNNTTGSTGVHDTAFAGIYRLSRLTNDTPFPILRIDGSDTPTGQFVEFTENTNSTGANVIDNANYIYLIQIWYCDDCLVQEFTVVKE